MINLPFNLFALVVVIFQGWVSIRSMRRSNAALRRVTDELKTSFDEREKLIAELQTVTAERQMALAALSFLHNAHLEFGLREAANPPLQ